jgi:lipopolysaccharide export system permease protein
VSIEEKHMLARQVLYKELLQQFLLVLIVVLFLISINQFTILLRLVSTGNMTFHTMLKLLSMMLPNMFCFIIPPCLFLAILFVLSRYYLDGEMTILLISGVSHVQVFKSIMFFSFVISMFVGVLMFQLFPSMQKAKRQIEVYASKEISMKKVVPGGFSPMWGGGVLYAKTKDDNNTDHSIYAFFPLHTELGNKMFWQVVSSASLHEALFPEFSAKRKYLAFGKGDLYRVSAFSLDWVVSDFNQWGYQVPTIQDVGNSWPENLAFWPLLMASSNSAKAASYFFWRLSVPLSILVLAFMGCALGYANSRQGKMARLIPGIIIYGLYFFSISSARELVSDGHWSMWLAILLVHGVMLLFASGVLMLRFRLALIFLFRRRRRGIT